MKKQILFLVMIIAAAGVISGCQKKAIEQTKEEQNSKTAAQETTSTSSLKDVDISDWLLYENDKYGFKLRYPKGIIPVVHESGTRPSIVFEDGNNFFEVGLIFNYDIELTEYSYLDFSLSEKGMIDNYEALVFKSATGYCDGPSCGYPFINYTTKVNGVFYNLTFYKMTELNDDAKKVLESFEFVAK